MVARHMDQTEIIGPIFRIIESWLAAKTTGFLAFWVKWDKELVLNFSPQSSVIVDELKGIRALKKTRRLEDEFYKF